MAVETNIYDAAFFRNARNVEGGSPAAATAVLMAIFNPKSVVDVGCGSGEYLSAFLDYIEDVAGYDGSPSAKAASEVADRIVIHDLGEPLNVTRRYDMALCVEVAEHLEEKYADILIDTLVDFSDLIIFTAATPGQGPRSIGHINEQPHGYWIEKFLHRKYRIDPRTVMVKEKMENSGVIWWVVKNLMIFKKNYDQ